MRRKNNQGLIGFWIAVIIAAECVGCGGHLTEGEMVRAKNLLALHGEAALGLRKTEAKLIWVPREQIVKRLGH